MAIAAEIMPIVKPCNAITMNLVDYRLPSATLMSPIERPAPSEDTPAQDIPIPATSLAPVNLPTDLDVPVAHHRAVRERRLPKRFRQDDDLPPTLAPASQQPVVVPVAQNEDGISEASTTNSPPTQGPAVVPECESPVVWSLILHQSRRSTFGVVKNYSLPVGHKLTHDPEQEMTLEGQSNMPRREVIKTTYGPFQSKSALSLADWYWGSTNKSFLDFQKLVAIFKQPDFSLNDVVDVNWRMAFKELGANPEDLVDSVDATSWVDDDGWTTTPINIDIPFHKQMRVNKGTTTNYCVGQLRHRRIVSVIKEKILNREDSRNFHYTPYRATWKPTEKSDEVELYGELYASRAFASAHEELQKLPSSTLNHNLERVVVAMMFWSDGTQLTNFAPASLWPCYLLFGNESKYRRCQPSERLANQIAYFQKLPDTLYEYLKNRNGGKVPYDGLMAYCVREAFHQQWSILLDDELRNAMQHGIRLLCPDGRERCFYPRIFTYSADYPEKVLLAGVRNNGLCPCHRCLVPATGLSKLGAPGDVERDAPRQESEIIDSVNKARELIDDGYAVDSKTTVEVHLKPQSLVPTKNAFFRFSGHPFDIRKALTVDLMHEFESGAWKKVFVHAIRLLEFFTTKSTTLTGALDERYRATPAFGRDGIRKFALNASNMKRKAAHDFANLLQCAIPAFESLLPEPHNTTFMELLYILAEWHALAKLRLHNDFTVSFLEYSTKLLGAQMRRFCQEVCEKIPTKELEKEAQARARKEGKAPGKSTRKVAKLAIFTIKWHFLGDYVSTIRWFGTTDSYSTETGELAHRLPKSWYPRTDKRDFEAQMSQIERRQARLGKIISNNAATVGTSSPGPSPPEGEIRIDDVEVTATMQGTNFDGTLPLMDATTESSPCRRYVIARNQGSPIDLSLFGETPGWDHDRDVYAKNFVPKLKRHLLPRILEKLGYDVDSIPQSEYCNVVLTGDRIYRHRLLRLNYTTYDVRRNEDVIHIDTPQCNAMLLNRAYGPETWSFEHAYIYGKCLGVYHANVSFVGCLPDGTRCYREHRLDFVWIHWYEHIATDRPLALDRLSFVPLDAPSAVGFVNPDDILQGVHIVPQFSLGEADVQVRSKWVSNPQKLYKSYYINRFADRDLFMRYQYGMSVGHTYMHQGSFPPPKVPQIPDDFNYWVGGDELGDPEGNEDEEAGIDQEEDPDSGGVSSLHYATRDMNEREANFYLEMYDGT